MHQNEPMSSTLNESDGVLGSSVLGTSPIVYWCASLLSWISLSSGSDPSKASSQSSCFRRLSLEDCPMLSNSTYSYDALCVSPFVNALYCTIVLQGTWYTLVKLAHWVMSSFFDKKGGSWPQVQFPLKKYLYYAEWTWPISLRYVLIITLKILIRSN